MNPGYDSKQIPHVSYAKFLEIIIDNSLSWKLHIEETVPKLYPKSGQLSMQLDLSNYMYQMD
jgi:hypothetical protein